MPMVCRQTPRAALLPSRNALSDGRCDTRDSVDCLLGSVASGCVDGTGRTNSSAGIGGTGALMFTIDSSKRYALVLSIHPPLLQIQVD